MRRSRSSACATSRVGCATVKNSGVRAPARFAARFMRSMHRIEALRAFGCGQSTMTLPPEIIEMPLLMIVSVGFVTGVMTAITP